MAGEPQRRAPGTPGPPRQLSQEDVLAAVSRSSFGLSIAELEREFPKVDRRTVQRRLAELVAKERLRRSGSGPTRRYSVPSDDEESDEESDGASGSESGTQIGTLSARAVERLRFEHEREKWRRLKLANDETEGKLIPAAAAKDEWGRVLSMLRGRLDALPDRVKRRAPGMGYESLSALRAEVVLISKSLSSYQPGG